MKNCVLITSVIEPDAAPFDYSPVRSVYTPQERYQQTLETIESIRRYIPDVFILLVECSPHSEMLDKLSASVDSLINLYPNELIRKSPYKGLSEAVMLEAGLKSLVGCKHKNIFKITGRYVLNEQFNYTLWDNDVTVALPSSKYGRGDRSLHTFLYKFPVGKLAAFTQHYTDMVKAENKTPTEFVVYDWLTEQGFLKIDGPVGITVRWSSYLWVDKY